MMLPTGDLRERFLGCLLGCAVGDALGAPFEGLWSHSIPAAKELLAGFAEYEGYPRGQYTDDTQLSMATVKAILARGDVIPEAIAEEIARLWRNESVIGPGGACTRAAHKYLKTRDWQRCGAPVGQAGNGTAMRTAVLGLFFVHNDSQLADRAAEVSRITHQDQRSIAGGVAVARAACLLTADRFSSPEAFCKAIAETVRPFEADFARLIMTLPELLPQPLSEVFPKIAWALMASPEFNAPIITPYVVPTVLAALWCVCRHPDSWQDAVAQAIGLGGDVDTLGAIVGALMGARLGMKAIPGHLVETVVDAEKWRVLAHRYHHLVTVNTPVQIISADCPSRST